MKEIPNFSLYYLSDNNEVIRKKDGKSMPLNTRAGTFSKYFKLKSDKGDFVQKRLSAIIASVHPPKPPEGFLPCPKFDGIFVSKEGLVWSEPNEIKPLGTLLTIHYPQCGLKYPCVNTAKHKQMYIHQLLALTYLDPEYLEKGLCVMHLDDDKCNFSLYNLKVGTYSENNQAAYDTGVNKR